MKNKYIIITGATGGIGSQIFRVCINNSDDVKGCLIYKNQNKFDDIFTSYDLNMFDTYQMDFGEIKKIDINTILKRNKIETIVLVLTAFSMYPIKKICYQNIEEIVNNININIVNQINIILEALKYSKENNIELRIININSGAAYRPIEGWSLYSSSKSYMNMYLKSLLLEEDIKIVSFDPGVVDTAMQELIREQDKEMYKFVDAFTDYKLEGKLNSPYEIASDIWKRYIAEWLAEKYEERFVKK